MSFSQPIQCTYLLRQRCKVLEDNFTVHKRSCGKVMFSQACVKKSVHRGVYTPPPGQTARPPRADSPLGRHHPGQTGRHPLGRHLPLGRHPPRQTGRHPTPQADTPRIRRPLQQTVRILLECIFVC